jgi:3D (Asp-Asp-Asp) domain-containing protein
LNLRAAEELVSVEKSGVATGVANMIRVRTVAIIALLVACESLQCPPVASAESLPAGTAEDFRLPAPATLEAGARRLIWSTAYIDYLAAANNEPDGVPLVNKVGDRLGLSLSHADWCHSAMEGTVAVQQANGLFRTFNFAGSAPTAITDCKDVFPHVSTKILAGTNRASFAEVPADAPFGLGARENLRLVPYRSIAVDQTIFPLETILFIPTLKGTPVDLPDGRHVVHDGYVVAVDGGGLIKDHHVDFFEGPSRSDVPPAGLQSNENHLIEAYVITEPVVLKLLLQLHQRH